MNFSIVCKPEAAFFAPTLEIFRAPSLFLPIWAQAQRVGCSSAPSLVPAAYVALPLPCLFPYTQMAWFYKTCPKQGKKARNKP